MAPERGMVGGAPWSALNNSKKKRERLRLHRLGLTFVSGRSRIGAYACPDALAGRQGTLGFLATFKRLLTRGTAGLPHQKTGQAMRPRSKRLEA